MDPVRIGYALLLGLAGAVCLGAILRAQQLSDADTCRGLVGLLATAHGWETRLDPNYNEGVYIRVTGIADTGPPDDI